MLDAWRPPLSEAEFVERFGVSRITISRASRSAGSRSGGAPGRIGNVRPPPHSGEIPSLRVADPGSRSYRNLRADLSWHDGVAARGAACADLGQRHQLRRRPRRTCLAALSTIHRPAGVRSVLRTLESTPAETDINAHRPRLDGPHPGGLPIGPCCRIRSLVITMSSASTISRGFVVLSTCCAPGAAGSPSWRTHTRP